MALTKKGIETLSVDAVRDSIMMADLLDQYIPDNDKEPFWDGAICVFSEKSHTKETFMGRMPVQVKGTENNDFSKDEIKFRVSTTDLKGYLKDGGAIFFVVYIGNNGLCKKIYYIELTPIRIRVILDEAKGQKSKFITLKTFPTDNNAIDNISILPNMPPLSSILNGVKLGYADESLSLQGLGYRNLILLLVLLNSWEKRQVDTAINVLIMEEPEAHLCINNIRLMCSFINALTKDNKQVQLIFASHSTEFINKHDFKNIVVRFL